MVELFRRMQMQSSEVTTEELKLSMLSLRSIDDVRIFLHDFLHEHKKSDDLQCKLNALVMQYASCCLAVVSSTGETLQVNQRVYELLGYEKHEMMQIGLHELFSKEQDHCSVEQLLCRKDGSWVLVGMTVAKAQLDGEDIYIVVFNDITEKKKYENEIKSLSSFPSENPDPIWRISSEHSVIYMNHAAETLLKTCPTNILQHDMWKQALFYVMDKNENCEIEFELGEKWFKCVFSYTNHGYMNVYGTDITNRVKATLALHKSYAEMEGKVEQRTQELLQRNNQLGIEINAREKVEEQLRKLSYQDELTGLGNRRRMNDRLEHAVVLGKRNDLKFALLFLDLDHFKKINDTLGHDAGDELLKQVAYRLEMTVRTSDTVVRMGGDEFAILLENIQQEEEVFKVAEAILDQLNSPFQLQNQDHKVHCSLGISLFPDHAESVDELFKCADIALYKSKELRNRYTTYNALVDSKVAYLNQLNHDLHDALEKQQLYLLYQPKVRLSDGKIIGAEALIRWQHPEYGVISPVEFIPIAEGNGTMVEIGAWVMQEACRTLKLWQKQYQGLCMAVNLSPMQFVEENLYDKVVECMQTFDIQPCDLEFEITETLTMDDPERSHEMIQNFMDLGISMAIDDFGTGYSSLARLKEMPIQTLKIDRSFISELCSNHNDRVFVEMIINMSQLLQLSTVAEGIESIEHINYLKKSGCEIGQGYYFSQPISSELFLNLLKEGDFKLNSEHSKCASCRMMKCLAGEVQTDFLVKQACV